MWVNPTLLVCHIQPAKVALWALHSTTTIMNNLQRQSISIVILTVSMQVAGMALALPPSDDPIRLSSATPEFPDKIVASKTAIGYFTNFSWGDYFYAVIKTSSGNITFLVDRDEDCFLAYHQKVKLKIRYDRLQRYIPQAGGYYPIDVIRNIQTNRTDLVRWRRSISPAKLKQCRQLIERATKSS
jgi:hypothetical protein